MPVLEHIAEADIDDPTEAARQEWSAGELVVDAIGQSGAVSSQVLKLVAMNPTGEWTADLFIDEQGVPPEPGVERDPFHEPDT